ncbi:TIGR03826 family flagellar region protein [Bacillus smithii]|uniref:TIGR03826 family flagellar region protein n=1 Tax=Bacillus smithii TaxID=1479 RepID=UPI0030C99A73
MGEISNCPRCGSLFMKTSFRDVCENCYKEEENLYEKVYKFLRKRENRAATISRVVEATRVDEELIYKWVRKGRLQPAVFPNMGYPCDNCGKIITKGKLCSDCADQLLHDLETFEKEQERKRDRNITYYSLKDDTQ